MLAGNSALEMGPQDWPDGCINFAVNLVRPVQEGHRKKILYRVLGSGLVFESLDSASKYREFVAQVRTVGQGCLVHSLSRRTRRSLLHQQVPDAYCFLQKHAIVCCDVTLRTYAHFLRPASLSCTGR